MTEKSKQRPKDSVSDCSRAIFAPAVVDSRDRRVSKRLSPSKAPLCQLPANGTRVMMPPLSRRGISENLPKNVTSVQRTVAEDFSEDRAQFLAPSRRILTRCDANLAISTLREYTRYYANTHTLCFEQTGRTKIGRLLLPR